MNHLAPGHWRRGNPRFEDETFSANLTLADRLQELAQEKRCTAAQLALAWLLRRHADVVPIPGTSSAVRLDENVRSAEIQLDEGDFRRIEHAFPHGAVQGERNAPEMMGIISS